MADPRTAAAVAQNQRLAAERALDNPDKLGKAVRLVRLAIERGRLRIPDVLPTGGAAPVELRRAPTGGERP